MYDLITANLTDCQPFNPAIIITGAISPFVEISDLLNELLGLLYGAEDLISQKSGQAITLFIVFMVPFVLIAIIFFAKLAYDVFTGAADSFGDAFLVARFKVKSFIVSKLFPDR